jgi:SAM-dependent methyltransferase
MSDQRLDAIGRCVDCKSERMSRTDGGYACPDCGRTYTFDDKGVLLAYASGDKLADPAFYRTPFFDRWMAAWRDMIPNWVIYRTAFHRFFSMSGHRQVVKMLKDTGPQHMIADFGCGPGQLFRILDAKRCVGLDSNLHFLHELKKNFPDAVAIHCDMRNSPLKSGSIDRPLSLHTLEHLYFLSESLEEILRILKPSGKFIFTIPTEGSWGWELGRIFVTGPTLRKKYNLDIHKVMGIEHLNDAKRVLKFVRFYMDIEKLVYAPFRVPILSFNSSITGSCVPLPEGSEFRPYPKKAEEQAKESKPELAAV